MVGGNVSQRRITVFLTGGLGNQLFQYAAALSRNPKILIIDHLSGSPRLNSMGIPDLFDYQMSTTMRKMDDPERIKFFRFSLLRLMKKLNWYLIRFGMQRSNIENFPIVRWLVIHSSTVLHSIWVKHRTKVLLGENNGYWEMPRNFPNEYLLGYFQSYKWASENSIFQSLKSLRLNSPSIEFQSHLEYSSMKRSVAVHVRLGDYKNDIGFGIPNPQYYSNALNAIDQREKIESIFLFSNEPEEAIQFLPLNFIDLVEIVPDFGGNSAETLEAMRHCHNYVIGNSSLSWWGAFLTYSANPLVVAPSPWFKERDEPRDLIPINWVRLDAWQ